MIRRVRFDTSFLPSSWLKSVLDRLTGEIRRRLMPLQRMFLSIRATFFRRTTSHSAALPADDESLDLLLKHALGTSRQEPNGSVVWQQLNRKVRGPFGTPALESPSLSSLEIELMQSGGLVQPAPFVVSDKALRGHDREHESTGAGPASSGPLWEMLRFVSSGLSQNGYAWLLT
jgi:hypothetical protein